MTKIKVKYKPAVRATPMLVVYNDINKSVFLDIKLEMNNSIDFKNEQIFLDSYNHIWNPFSYIIYKDSLEIISFVYTDIAYLFYLLRFINKELFFLFNIKYKDKIKKEFKEWFEEVEIVK